MKRTPRIELDTPILPHVIAESIREEASVWLGRPLPRRWVRELIARANTVYARNPRFRRSVRAAGDRGRDHLWVFMRHWLAGLMWERRPQLYARMPASHTNGHPLPPKPSAQPRRLKEAGRTARPARRYRPPARDCAWAAAAHFHGA